MHKKSMSTIHLKVMLFVKKKLVTGKNNPFPYCLLYFALCNVGEIFSSHCGNARHAGHYPVSVYNLCVK